jgi:hypothetical protein
VGGHDASVFLSSYLLSRSLDETKGIEKDSGRGDFA